MHHIPVSHIPPIFPPRRPLLTTEVPMRSVIFPGAALALLTFCSPGNNRRTGETGMATDTAARPSTDSAAAAPGAEAVPPAAILSQLYGANTTEIQVSKLAARKAASPAVKRIAGKLAAHHA